MVFVCRVVLVVRCVSFVVRCVSFAVCYVFRVVRSVHSLCLFVVRCFGVLVFVCGLSCALSWWFTSIVYAWLFVVC